MRDLTKPKMSSGKFTTQRECIFPKLIFFLTASSGNKYPSSWTSVAVKNLFESESENTSSTTNSATSISTVQPGPSSSTVITSRSHLNHNAIIGIALGCTAAIVCCAIGIFALIRKSKPPIPNFDQKSQELPAEQERQEIMSRQPDRAELPIERSLNAGLNEMSAGARPVAELYTSAP